MRERGDEQDSRVPTTRAHDSRPDVHEVTTTDRNIEPSGGAVQAAPISARILAVPVGRVRGVHRIDDAPRARGRYGHPMHNDVSGWLA